ncbi:MAG: hypothetical protein HN337_00995 [Deltaproteobacteria bacterium]|jgi:hypothetical protein|nr:hypothetical protein [Deltaproteobacteria bacterium]
MKKIFITIPWALMFVFCISTASAKVSANVRKMVASNYPAAAENKSLLTAHDPFQMDALRGFVVLKKGGIPMERARHFISWQEYDYRGVVVHLDKNDKITTRRGRPYGYLQRGDVLAVAELKYFRNTIYLKLITPDVYIPDSRQSEKRHSRVTVMLGFRFPKEVFKSDNVAAVMAGLKQWLEPFNNLNEAKAFGAGLKLVKAEQMVETEENVQTEEEYKTKVKAMGVEKAVDEEKIKKEAKMEVLEDKIDAAKRQMEEAEKEIKELKKDMKK